ncbi:MAG: hypothetical protein HUU01_16760 [Saprospiraceae bacterium]|nr:hypothetical protein [Saprospiraceae bacterium]
MDKLQLIAEIKRLVGKADVEKALQRLVEELEKAGSGLANDAIQAQSLFQKTQKDEKQGLVSFENAKLNYNQVTDQILDLLEALKKEGGNDIQAKPAKRLLPWIAGGVLALAAIAALFFYTKKEVPPVSNDCPVFEDTAAFKILVLPFKPIKLGDNGVLPNDIHRQIKGKLADLLNGVPGIKAKIEYYNIDPIKEESLYPDVSDEAEKIARNCNAQLIIWGTAEKQASGENIVLTKYKFREIKNLTKLLITGNTEVDTITSLSSIFTQGLLTDGIFANMQLLFGVIANEMGKPGEAIAQLEQVQPTDSSTTVLVNMALSNSHLAANHPEKAIESLNKVLETHPGYWLAVNNRAVLNYEMGNTAAALQDVGAFIELQDTAKLTDAYLTRSALSLKAQSIDKAEEYINEASKLATSKYTREIQQLKEVITKEKREQLKIKKEAELNLQANPEDTKELEKKANADKKLGNIQEAVVAAKAAFDNYSTDPGVYKILLEDAAKNDTNLFKKVAKKADQVGISRKELSKDSRVLQERFKMTRQ